MNIALILSIMWAGVIFGASSVPQDALPPIGTPDYVAHLVEYAIFGIFLMWWRSTQGRRPFGSALLEAVALGSVYGITDEFHQAFVPGRTPDPSDWVADTLGVFLGAVMVFFFLYLKKRSAHGN